MPCPAALPLWCKRGRVVYGDMWGVSLCPCKNSCISSRRIKHNAFPKDEGATTGCCMAIYIRRMHAGSKWRRFVPPSSWGRHRYLETLPRLGSRGFWFFGIRTPPRRLPNVREDSTIPNEMLEAPFADHTVAWHMNAIGSNGALCK